MKIFYKRVLNLEKSFDAHDSDYGHMSNEELDAHMRLGGFLPDENGEEN